MQYNQIWNAVDKLAKSRGLSPSGLAKIAGLDATTFNKSKRSRPDGKKRWPSLESLNKILETCNISFEDFYKLGADYASAKDTTETVPYIRYSDIDENINIYEGNVNIENWGRISFPDSQNAYAIDIDTNEFAPYYRINSVIIVAQNSDIRRGDKVVIYQNCGNVIIGEFVRRTAQTIELNNIALPQSNISVKIANIRIIQRIIWASQ